MLTTKLKRSTVNWSNPGKSVIQWLRDRTLAALRTDRPPPGLASQPSPPAIWIEWDVRGKELSPNIETETLQEARFELSVENDPMGDWSLTGYQWSYRYPPLPGQSIPANACRCSRKV